VIRPWAGELLNDNLIRAGDFSVLHRVISGPGAYSGYYPMGTGCPVPLGTAMGQEVDCTPPSLGMNTLLGLHGMHKDNFTFTVTEL